MQQFLHLEDGTELYPSKILCIARNYVDHIKELQNSIPDAPFYFSKPNSALLNEGKRIVLPKHSQSIHHEMELAIVIGKEGRFITKDKVNDFILGYACALDLTARDIQTKLKEKGYPWELAKAFDHSCPISTVRFKEHVKNAQDLNFELKVNGQVRQSSNTSLMISSIADIISDLSNYFTLEKGDIILTGTPKGVAGITSGDVLEGKIDSVGTIFFEVA
jgi:acylpyruvate hydrolase